MKNSTAGGQGDGFAAASDGEGATWTAIEGSEGWGYNWALAVAKHTLLVGGDNGLASSPDGGKSFARVPGIKPCLGVGGRAPDRFVGASSLRETGCTPAF